MRRAFRPYAGTVPVADVAHGGRFEKIRYSDYPRDVVPVDTMVLQPDQDRCAGQCRAVVADPSPLPGWLKRTSIFHTTRIPETSYPPRA